MVKENQNGIGKKKTRIESNRGTHQKKFDYIVGCLMQRVLALGHNQIMKSSQETDS